MPVTLDADVYPTDLYTDPLLMPLYLQTTNPTSIDAQVDGDWLLKAYIVKLSEEIADAVPEFKDHEQLVRDIFCECRKHGWCVVKFYTTPVDSISTSPRYTVDQNNTKQKTVKQKDTSTPTEKKGPHAEPTDADHSPDEGKEDSTEEEVKVFTTVHKTDWIREDYTYTNSAGESSVKQRRVGIKVQWNDDLGNDFTDECYFGEDCYLFLWQKGNGKSKYNLHSDSQFAVPDLTLDLFTLAIGARQILAQMNFSAVISYFIWFMYGNNITPEQRTAVLSALSHANPKSGFGATEGVVKGITSVENSAVEKTLVELEDQIGFFAGATRLPLSFYLGEKKTGGLGDTGESTDEVKVAAKKESILRHFLPQLTLMFSEQFGVSLSPETANFFTQEIEQKQQEEQERLTQSQEKQGKPNGEKNNGSNPPKR